MINYSDYVFDMCTAFAFAYTQSSIFHVGEHTKRIFEIIWPFRPKVPLSRALPLNYESIETVVTVEELNNMLETERRELR